VPQLIRCGNVLLGNLLLRQEVVMRTRVARTTSVATTLLGAALAVASGARLSAQSGPTPACALLSASEIRKATGIEAYGNGHNGDQEGEGAGGGSSCQYGGGSLTGPDAPLLSLVLIRGKGYTESARKMKLPAGCTRETVRGVGDQAFFENCPIPNSRRSPPLYVKAGSNDLIVQMDIEPPATAASVKLTVIAVAKAAAAKLQ
jgi:hypothetical protein